MGGSPGSLIAEQFDDLEQQQGAAKLGMWVFLAAEVMFFGGLFLAYTVYRYLYPDAFTAASRHTEIIFGGANAAVLLFSSMLMALAVRASQLGRRRQLVRLLLATALLGIGFLVIKGFEYHKDFTGHLVPGASFIWHEANPRAAELFFWFYFAMTGLHAIHVTVGIGLMLVLAILAGPGAIYQWQLHASRDRRTLLTLRGHRLGVSFLAALPRWASMMEAIPSPKIYWKNFAWLIGLLALTWGIGYINLGLFNLVVALSIAIAKMILIALFFMHLKGSSRLLHLAAIAGILWLFLMLVLTLADYFSRGEMTMLK